MDGRPAVVTLKRRLSRAIRGGHPWLFREAVEAPKGLVTGRVVDVVEPGGRFVARGLFDASSPLAVRLWTTERAEALDDRLVARRIAEAWRLRRSVLDLAQTDAFRLLHGEGDRMPGVVCDLYGHSAVLRLDTPAVEWLLPAVTEAVRRALPDLRRVLLRAAGGGEVAGVARGGEDASRTPGTALRVLAGSPPSAPATVREHGMRMEVDLAHGHKTGLYLDQRDNRLRVRGLAEGKRVLDLFSYTGGFALSAALGGAASVTAVDQAAPALETARRSFAQNGLDPDDDRWRFVAGDVFDFLAREHERYDLIVLDPPSMAPSAATLSRAIGSYRRLNALALGRLEAGGLLLTASCSSHVTEARFLAMLAEAAGDADRPLRILEVRGAGADHPWPIGFPEGRYLKVVLAEVP